MTTRRPCSSSERASPSRRDRRPSTGGRPAGAGCLRLVELFDEKAGRCGSDAELRMLLEDVARELGFRHFALLHHASLRARSASLVKIDNYPEGWEEELTGRDLVAGDPVHLASARTHLGFSWSRLGELLAVTPAQRQILERSADFGIGEGFTVPANVPGEPAGSVSFAVARGKRLPRRALPCAELIGARAFGAARRLCGRPPRGRPRLSRRELECLRLLAAGKTDWEMAAILGISVETAHQYVKRARSAYDVVTRTQLVVHGLRDAWISFDDAIPPDG